MNDTNRSLALAASILFLAVAFGAFGAHGLKERLDPEKLAIYQTAVQYQFWHGLGLALVAVITRQYGECRLLTWSGRLMAAGVLIFSGSLYVLAMTGIRWLGAITPIGGICFLMGWLLLAIFGWRSSNFQ